MTKCWMRVGMAVRHNTKADWGIGEVIRLEAETCEIRFPSGLRTFDFERAMAGFVKTDEPIPATPSVRKPRGTGLKCKSCDAVLRSGIYHDDEKWKACPNCSGNNKVEHVLRKFPEAFGTVEERAADPATIQGFCAACRIKEKPTDPGRLCSSFD